MYSTRGWRRHVVGGAILAIGLVGLSATPAAAGKHDACRNGYVSISYDDGPTASTPTLLRALRRADLMATFFDVGERATVYPAYVVQERQDGHVIANHSYDHPDLTTLTAADDDSQLRRTQQILTPLAGKTPTLFRPPYGAINDTVRQVASGLNLTPVIWTVDTEDWAGPSTSSIVARALTVKPGGFVLMHDGYPNTIAAVPGIASGLAKRGLCAGRIVPSATPTQAWEGLDFPASVVQW
ncbi:MAG: hypothetical protein QOF21_1628 [Actinomycetota bacterium]